MNTKGYHWTIAISLLGFASGLPLALSGSTLQAWFADAGVDLKTIGALSLLGLPYLLKAIWAPFFDRYPSPWCAFKPLRRLSRRRGWLLTAQLGCLLLLLIMAHGSPAHQAHGIALAALALAFCSASQDIVFDAYRCDLLLPAQRSLGAALTITGYRMAMLVSGGLALVMAGRWSWSVVYHAMAALMAVACVVTCLAPEPVAPERAPATLFEAAWRPWLHFFKTPMALGLLAFVVLYKLGDAFALSLSTTFLLRGMHFTLSDVGWLYKTAGMAATLVGAFVGGWWQPKLGLYRSLWLFGWLQAISNLMFVLLWLAGTHKGMLVLTIVTENFCGGLGSTVLVALLMALCDARYSATQFALLTAASSVGRIFVGPLAASVVAGVGWGWFFGISVLVCLPGLVLLLCLRRHAVFATMRPQLT